MFLGHLQTNSPVTVRIIITQPLIAVVRPKIVFMGVAVNLFLTFTVCSLNCGPGYIPDDICSVCVVLDVCIAVKPCQNEGFCVTRQNIPMDYICQCNDNTGFTGRNCSGEC